MQYRVSLAAVLALTLVAARARAAVFNVDHTGDDTTQDCDDGTSNDCSLRGAILAANALSETSTINLPAGTYVLSQSSTCSYRVTTSSPGTFTSSQIPLCLSQDITIHGAGAATTIIDGNDQGRVLFVSADAVAEVRGVALQNGNGGSSFNATTGGGGVQNHGTLTLTESEVSGNTLPGVGARGAGIENFGTLFLHRSAVLNNVAAVGAGSGGGIHNEGFNVPGAVLHVRESTISGNTAGSFGGGISNGATTTIIASTISGNTAAGSFGGGIANLHAGGNVVARLTVINSTLSDNQCASQGGGIYNGTLTVARVSNTTITDNTANTGMFSRGGGGINNQASEFTLQNTIIAGNHDLGSIPGPDCYAEAGNALPVTSGGHNLIQDASHCTLIGDTTGNLTGVDPKLGALANDGGPTETHALLPDSPAVDAGSPAAPGSGGTACTAIDQQGTNRLEDGDGDGTGRCDIGARERARGADTFSLSGIRPNTGGAVGSVIALIYGSGFVPGATVKLTRQGEPDITGEMPTVTEGGALLTARFDLEGQAVGTWDVVVTNPDDTTLTEPAAFTIEAAGAALPWTNIVGPEQIRVARPARFTVLVGNRGNVDAEAMPVVVILPANIALDPRFPIAPPPPQPGQVPTDWAQVPTTVEIDGVTYLSLVVPVVPAGFTLALEVTVTAPVGTAGTPFQIRADMDVSQLESEGLALLIAGARSYAERELSVTIPSSVDPLLEQFATTQLQSMVELGRSALIARGGTTTDVYSSRQAVIDLAQFGASQVVAGFGTGTPRLASRPPRPNAAWVEHAWRAAALFVLPRAAHAADTASCAEIGRAYDARSGECRCDVGSGRCPPGGGSAPKTVGSLDPNDKSGAAGHGVDRFVPGNQPLPYLVRFENVETATAPAQEVVITDQLDGTEVDFDTFSLGPITFGESVVVPPPGLRVYTTSVDLRPARNLVVTIDARLNDETGVVTWRFTSIDPITGEYPEDPLAGFLPPNVDPPEGDGSVLFTVHPFATDQTICNQASIVFDENDAIETPEWCNRIDTTPPTSAVDPMVAGCSGELSLLWSGSDDGAGIDTFTIFVSEDDGLPTPWLENTTETSGVYPGEPGKTYAFSSVARDHVGNVEAPPVSPDVVVTPATGCCTTSVDCADGNACNGEETCNTTTGGCNAGAPLVCPNDDDPCTSDTCVPATGCAHTPITPCPAACAIECPDDDPCTAEECVDAICTRPDLTGVAGARCVCDRPPLPACDGQSMPDKLGKKTAAACRALDGAATTTKVKRRTKLLAKAVKHWGAAERLLSKPAVTTALSPACIEALDESFTDAASRASRAPTTP